MRGRRTFTQPVLLGVAALALACASARPWSGPPAADPCERGAAVACHALGVDRLAGAGLPRDARRAAAAFMIACEAGRAQACADLGALYAAGRGVRRDDARACDLGLAAACARVGRPAPPGALEPSPPVEAALASDGREPAAGLSVPDGASTAIEVFVPEEDRPELALDAPALAAHPLAAAADVAVLDPLVRARLGDVDRCLPVDVTAAGERWPERARVSFLVGADGRPTDVRTTARGPDRDCLLARVGAWELPVPHAPGRRAWFVAVGAGREVQADERRFAGWKRPVEMSRGCVRTRVVVPPTLMGLDAKLVVKFAIDRDATPSRFEVLAPQPFPSALVELAASVKRAVWGCGWIPGTDPEGRPAKIWVVLPLRFRPG